MKSQLLPRWIAVLLFFLTVSIGVQAQQGGGEIDHSYKPLTVKLNDTGSKYVRFIIWHQQWVQTNNLAQDEARLQLTTLARRSRFLAYAQVSPRFLILTHFGLNNLTPGNLTRLGNNAGADAAQLFLHDAWSEFKVSKNEALHIGGGLHYWNGLTRLSSQSTLNFMTLDNPRPFVHWHSLAVTDQFARHLGVYAKGQIGKFDYRISLNNPGRNGISTDYSGKSDLTYDGVLKTKEGDPTGNTIFSGYLRYNFWETESTKLPYQVGSYLGTKKVFGIGAGWFSHANGMFNNVTGEHENVLHLALDAFLDLPTKAGGCLNVYASFMNFNYGENFVSRWAGTGNVFYGHVGYKIGASRFMPYLAFQQANYEGFEENITGLDIGINYFILGHNAKITLEYHQITNDIREAEISDFNNNNRNSQIRLQGVIFL